MKQTIKRKSLNNKHISSQIPAQTTTLMAYLRYNQVLNSCFPQSSQIDLLGIARIILLVSTTNQRTSELIQNQVSFS